MANKEMCQLRPFVKIIFFIERLIESCRDGLFAHMVATTVCNSSPISCPRLTSENMRDGCGVHTCVQELTHAHKNENKQTTNKHVEFMGRGGMPRHPLCGLRTVHIPMPSLTSRVQEIVLYLAFIASLKHKKSDN